MKNIRCFQKIIRDIYSFTADRKNLTKGVNIFYTSIFMKILYLITIAPVVIFALYALLFLEHIQQNLLETLSLIIIVVGFSGYTLMDIYGRYIAIWDGKLIQRRWFYNIETVELDAIVNCYIKIGISIKEKRGALTVRIKHSKGVMDINAAYYSRKDIGALTTFIGFPIYLR
jgi:hypothetical protein